MTQKKLNLAVFVSGGGSNLQAIIDACAQDDFPAHIQIVIANNPDAYGIERAKRAGLNTAVINHREFGSREKFENALQNELSNYTIDLICLAGFMRILTPSFITRWDNKIINTHPSLLPKFGGEGMYGHHVHEAVLAAGESESGSTIHYVIPEVDKGKIVLQKRVPVKENDTADTLAERVLAQEHLAYPEAIEKIAAERLDN